jgi:hypothetical protein
MNTERRAWTAAPRLQPLLGAAVGAVGAGVYWASAQLWPSSVAVMLSMLAMALLPPRMGAAFTEQAGSATVLGLVFTVLIKYNALMGLSTASLPFAVPPNVALGIFMIAGNAASRALAVSMKPASYGSLGIALALGFAPAALIGVPGLSGLAAAILGRIGFGAYLRRRRTPAGAAEIDASQQLTEACFYLGALATRAYI